MPLPTTSAVRADETRRVLPAMLGMGVGTGHPHLCPWLFGQVTRFGQERRLGQRSLRPDLRVVTI